MSQGARETKTYLNFSLGSQQSRIFITIPRFDEGRPVTLGVLDQQGRVYGYPDYSWHDNQGHNCDGLTSVFRISVSAIILFDILRLPGIVHLFITSPTEYRVDALQRQVILRHF